MSRGPRFEIVRTDAGHHARLRAGNGEVVWVTEVYTRRAPAQNAVGVLARVFRSPTDYAPAGVEVRDVDERTPPPPSPVIVPPFYVCDLVDGGMFWHDRAWHWRDCYGDNCTEGTPPPGTQVRGRTGLVKFAGENGAKS